MVVVAGAGIGGLTAALALARNGFRVVVLEQAERLEETGAGIQLSPNAARILIELGLAERLRPLAVEPTAIRVLNAVSGREIVRMPLGEAATQRYGAPYWVMHRGDLQAALSAAATRQLDVTVRLGLRVQDFVTHAQGLTVSARGDAGETEVRGIALLAADGLWSAMRKRLGHHQPPRFAGRTAWRGLIPAKDVAPEFREPIVHLWLGRDAHFVHYPVKAGRVINAVLITANPWNAPGWSEAARRTELIAQLPAAWAPPVRALAALPEAWLKWALYDRRPIRRWYGGPAALLGDAAHPMLPFAAQGAAMAIEDAAVAAACLAQQPDDVAAALRSYCAVRRARTRKVARLAARNGFVYELGGGAAWLRDAVMGAMGGARLLGRYDWVYDWHPPAALSLNR